MKLLIIFLLTITSVSANTQLIDTPPAAMGLVIPESYTSKTDKLNQIVIDSDVSDSLLYDLKNIDPKVHCMAVNAYHEARGEPLAGVAGVVEVVKNRKKSSGFPDSACAVVTETKTINAKKFCQFSWYCNRKQVVTPVTPNSNDKAKREWRRVVIVALAVNSGLVSGFVGSATHFYNHKLSKPSWAKKARNKYVVSNHTFLEM